MNILSIQSHVAYGHVGNASAVFAAQRLGVEVWPIHTVQFSNHTGYGEWTGRVFDGPFVDELLDGIEARGVLPSCDGVLSGYMGSADVGSAILAAVQRVREANPDATYCCDPVIGDVGRGVFVRPGIPELIREQAVPRADVITPNHFELDYLSGIESRTVAELERAVEGVQALGPRTVLATSVHLEDTPDDAVDLVAGEGGRAWRVRTPRLDLSVNGAGDMIAAMFYVHRERSGSTPEALAAAAASTWSVLKATEDAGSRELLLVATQGEIVAPSRLFAPEPLAP
ncbi:MAG TPA: pyridoxal kinase PdxY [Baekduia sp.]|nr:pyridoxal kinase PdxY [Baekduia sp.]